MDTGSWLTLVRHDSREPGDIPYTLHPILSYPILSHLRFARLDRASNGLADWGHVTYCPCTFPHPQHLGDQRVDPGQILAYFPGNSSGAGGTYSRRIGSWLMLVRHDGVGLAVHDFFHLSRKLLEAKRLGQKDKVLGPVQIVFKRIFGIA